MQVLLLAVGTRMPAWVQAGFDDYAARLPPQLRLVLREIPAGRRTRGADLARIVREEGERLLAAIPPRARVVALDRQGRPLSSETLAAELEKELGRGEDLVLLVGGPEGLASACLARAADRWSLSRLTFAHPLVRVIVAEQIYRAWSILNNLPYHR